MKQDLFFACVSGHYVKEYKKSVGRGGVIGLKREVYAKLSRPSADLREITTMIRVDNFFRGWFDWTNLNECRIRMIIESIESIPKRQLIVVGFDRDGNVKSRELEDALLIEARKILRNHDYPISKKEKGNSHVSRR